MQKRHAGQVIVNVVLIEDSRPGWRQAKQIPLFFLGCNMHGIIAPDEPGHDVPCGKGTALHELVLDIVDPFRRADNSIISVCSAAKDNRVPWIEQEK